MKFTVELTLRPEDVNPQLAEKTDDELKHTLQLDLEHLVGKDFMVRVTEIQR